MTTRRLPRLAGLAAAAALLAVSCGGTSESADNSVSAPAPAASSAPAASTGSEMPASGVPEILAFSSPLVGGGQLDGAELADKPTAFWFWSPT